MSNTHKAIIIASTSLGLILFSWIFISLSNKFFPRQDVPTMKEGSVIAENWIRNNSVSYPFYGKNLKLTAQEEILRGEYHFSFSFITDNPEYGTQENKINIKTKNTEIVEAITNDVFDEINNKFVEKSETLELFFVIQKEDEEIIEGVERVVTSSVVEDIEKVLLIELLKGPNEEEATRGYFSYIETGTELFSFNIDGETAYLELSIGIDQQTEMGQEQIKKTLAQFEGIKEVRAPERKRIVKINVEGIPEDFLFSRELKEGAKGIDVKYLQMILNADPDTMVAQQGPGSPGEEVESFSESTTRAVKSFQRKYADEVLKPAGLILSNGIVNEHTRDKLNAILEENRW
jgi:hypothetical protein